MIRNLSISIAVAASLTASMAVLAQERTAARLFWQDDWLATLRYGDLKRSADDWSLQPTNMDDFPSLDLPQQSLVQMQTDDGLILVGIHDHAGGTLESGWVAIESGLVEESHGDHSHWLLKDSPRVIHSMLDADQGNPAHVYKYGKSFLIANDKLNGFTVTSASKLRAATSPAVAAAFHEGGNSHITLAAIDNQVAYATWIARDGDDIGRVDVVGLGDNRGMSYSIHCPTGGLHGATINSGKIFLAPVDGICWLNADPEIDDTPESVQINHLSLGKDADDNPLRTGALTNLDKLVLFTTGKGEESRLCWIDATANTPVVKSLHLDMSEGESLASVRGVKARGGRRLAVMFSESRESPENDALLVVDLDGSADDTTAYTRIGVGRNRIEGHSGHHEAVVLPGRRNLALTNPADGTISIISLETLKVTCTLKVEGTPTRLISIGK